MRHQKLIGIFAIAIFALNLVIPLYAQVEEGEVLAAAESADWYMTVPGVLHSDTYVLYPYKTNSIKVGLSKYGELIDSNQNIGLEYADARDPFAAPAGPSVDVSKLPKKVWINGWYIDIRYVHEDWGPRNVWAGALFADKSDYGKNWIRVDNNYTYPLAPRTEEEESFDDKGLELVGFTVNRTQGLVYGGRKTNGTAITEPLTILYDGPRLFAAKSTTHIYDWNEDTDENLHLVDVVLTIIFNKVKKEVIVLKDVKFIDQAKAVLADLPITVDDEEIRIPSGLLIQFSNREEWDLGEKGVSGTTDYSSYVHFYTAGTAPPEDTLPEAITTVYNKDWTMLPTLPAGVVYRGVQINAHGPEPGACGTYDVAQIISNDKRYVGWHAFWPSLSDWTADGFRGTVKTWFRAMNAGDPHYIDSYSGTEPFLAPLVVGEWDFILADSENTYGEVKVNRQFRGVSVYGVTELNDGSDAQIPGTNNIDKEVLYQLNEVFNPWDLLKAIHKDTVRHVKFVYGPKSSGEVIPLAEPLVDAVWDSYCNFTERVLLLPDGTLWKRGTQYILNDSDNDGAYDSIKLLTSVASGKTLKILYSNESVPGRYEWGIVGKEAHSVDSAGLSLVSAAFKNKQVEYGLAGADMYDSAVANQMPWVMRKFGTGYTKADYYYSSTDKRTALKDDWCRTWPIASSNMIGVGGCLANLLAYYGNDFMTAFFALGDFTDYNGWENKIVPLTCWDITKTRAFTSSETTGYAVISTYKDLNGTVLFLIWGHWGRDTYYITKWFHEEGIYQLQEAPPGLTSIIVEITYTSTPEGYKPTGYSIVECLGTISETEWIHGDMIKGGIHDP
jgi:hypothetical protein